MDGEQTVGIELIDIEQEMRAAYLDYAMSVITARALPDVRDGLKPVQRRVLYTMYDNGLRPDRPFKKSAATVGDVLGRFHPHGDGPVYDAMVRLAQDFSMRYLLVDGQGNFGSVDGDPAAAYRYTEARPTAIALELLADIDKETVDFRPNFDDSQAEPVVLPSRAPNLLMNGASGIAVGMATNIPPHNLGELCDALVYLIDRYDELDDVTVRELMQFVKGPDFPTGASIIGDEGIVNAYATGHGRVIMRGETHFEELAHGRAAIIIDAIPYQVNKATLVERIADLARAKKIDTISDLRDETDRHGTRVVIELKRGADPHTTLNRLMKYTALQQTFGVNMLALVDGVPRVLPLKRMLALFLEHRIGVIRRRSEYELARARARQHVLEGLRIALQDIDGIIDTIRSSEDAASAKDNLMDRYGLSEIQAQAILDAQLRRLAGLERQKIEEEYAEVSALITELERLLGDEHEIRAVLRDDLVALRARYADERRTTILHDETSDLSLEDLVEPEDVLVTLSDRGYVKRVSADEYRSQVRGGRGSRGVRPRGDDEVRDNLLANTHDVLLFFTDRGRVFQLPAHRVPEAGRDAAGTPLPNLIQIDQDERVTVTLAVPRWQFEQGSHLIMATRRGRIKRTVLREYEGVRPSGLIAINLDEGDALGWARVTSGDDEVLIVTRRGRALRFGERAVRSMGRAAAGVRAIRLRADDEVASIQLVRPEADLLVVTRQGWGKRTPLSEYAAKGRYTGGVLTIDVRRLDEIGEIADAHVVQPGDEVALITDHGIVIRTVVDAIGRKGRATRGVRVMRLDEGHHVVSVALIAARPPAADDTGDAPEDGAGGTDGEGAVAPGVGADVGSHAEGEDAADAEWDDNDLDEDLDDDALDEELDDVGVDAEGGLEIEEDDGL